jgi:hypothetical protein
LQIVYVKRFAELAGFEKMLSEHFSRSGPYSPEQPRFLEDLEHCDLALKCSVHFRGYTPSLINRKI